MTAKAYKLDETAIVWTDTTGDLGMTLNNLASGAGRQGAQKDLGAGATARANRFWWIFLTQFETTPVVDEMVNIYLKYGHDAVGSMPSSAYTNDDGTGDIALSSEDKLKNLDPLRPLIVDQAAADISMSVQGMIEIDPRYVMPVVFNDTADNLQATNNVSFFALIPMPYQLQET